jgi:transmembrane sensor
MKKYNEFDVEDFVWDTDFRQWVLSPNREINAFWEGWIEQNSDKIAIFEQAKVIVNALKIDSSTIKQEEIDERINQTISKINDVEAYEPEKVKIFYYPQKQWLKIAASIFLLMGIGFWVTQFSPQKPSVKGVYEKLVAENPNELVEVKNENEKTLPIQLIDGSLVLLKKGSRISYSTNFMGNTREIFLSGEAFFEVTKNPEKPFLVFANGLVTKVLGTSFNIKAYDKDKDVTVEVKSGKVSVFAQSDANSKEKATNRELGGVVLTPNQKIVYAREEVRMAKTLVEMPIIIEHEKIKTVFEFEDTPVTEILRTLEKAYSIDIVFDEELLSNCPLTASLTDLQLFDKLAIICKGVEAHYEILDGQIVIYSKGCK